MPDIRIAPRALKILRPLARRAERLGLPVYAVGGCVRDWILGRPTFDIDLVTPGDPAPLAAHCGRLLGARPEAFGRFNTLRVLDGNGWRFDFAASRRENYPSAASLPVVAAAPIEEDLRRRDFTVNAMAARLRPEGLGLLLDPHGGLEDLRRGILRPLHPASFRDDPTRVFRAARYACRLDLKPAPGLLDMARAALKAGHAALLSRHRLAQELLRLLAEKDPACPLTTLRSWGYLQLIHPGLRPAKRWLAGVEERLAALALSLGPQEGAKFMGSLPVDHDLGARIMETLRLASGRASPRARPSELAVRVLSHALPGLPGPALKPLMIAGRDLEASGLAPGKEYRRILDAAARAQWDGKFSSRRQALRWLRAFTARLPA